MRNRYVEISAKVRGNQEFFCGRLFSTFFGGGKGFLFLRLNRARGKEGSSVFLAMAARQPLSSSSSSFHYSPFPPLFTGCRVAAEPVLAPLHRIGFYTSFPYDVSRLLGRSREGWLFEAPRLALPGRRKSERCCYAYVG